MEEQNTPTDAPQTPPGSQGATQTPPTESPEAPKTPGNSKQPLLWGGIIVLVIIIGIIALIVADNNGNGDQSQVLAEVNGEEVTVGDIEPLETQRRSEYEAQGMEVPEEDAQAIRQDALASKIRQTVLMQYAEDEGITVDEADVEAEFEQVTAQFGGDEEALQNALEQSGLTPDDIRQSIREGLILEEIARHIGDIEVSDEDVRAQYDAQAAQNPEGLPPFEEIESVFRQNLEQEQVITILIELFNELYAEADIEIMDAELEEGVLNSLSPAPAQGTQEVPQEGTPAPAL